MVVKRWDTPTKSHARQLLCPRQSSLATRSTSTRCVLPYPQEFLRDWQFYLLTASSQLTLLLLGLRKQYLFVSLRRSSRYTRRRRPLHVLQRPERERPRAADCHCSSRVYHAFRRVWVPEHNRRAGFSVVLEQCDDPTLECHRHQGNDGSYG